jgi:hypothetical protein
MLSWPRISIFKLYMSNYIYSLGHQVYSHCRKVTDEHHHYISHLSEEIKETGPEYSVNIYACMPANVTRSNSVFLNLLIWWRIFPILMELEDLFTRVEHWVYPHTFYFSSNNPNVILLPTKYLIVESPFSVFRLEFCIIIYLWRACYNSRPTEFMFIC